jgi:hypothetical protein
VRFKAEIITDEILLSVTKIKIHNYVHNN